MASAVVGALRLTLGLDSAAFSAGLKTAESRLGAFTRSLTPAITRLAAYGAAAASAAAAVAVYMTKAAFSSIDAQAKLAQRLGATTAAVQALEHAADLAGVSTETLTAASDKLNRALGDAARKGSGPAFEALQRLGISAREISSLDADEKLALIADRIAEAGLNAQDTASALGALGIKQAAIINLIAGGGDAIRSARDEVERFGIAVSDLDAAKVEAANDAWTRAMLAVKGVVTQLTVQLAPIIEAIAVGFTEAAASGRGFGVEIADAFRGVIRFGAGFLDVIRQTERELVGVALVAARVAQVMQTLANPTLLGKPSPLVEELQRRLDELSNMTMPTKEVDEWFDNLERKANEAALSVALARAAARRRAEILGTPGTSGETEEEKELREKAEREAALEAERAADRLQSLRESLMSEAEAERNSYEQRLAQLNAFLAAGQITQDDYASLRARAEQAYHDASAARTTAAAQKLADIEEKHREETLQKDRELAAQRAAIFRGYTDSFSSILDSLGTLIGEEGRKQFEMTKALSIASATIKGIEAVVSSYAAGAAIGGPVLGGVFAAAAAAATAAQIAMIARQQYSGGGGGTGAVMAAGAAASTPTTSTPASGGSVMYLQINGQQFGRQQVEDLARQLIDFQKDGGKVVLS